MNSTEIKLKIVNAINDLQKKNFTQVTKDTRRIKLDSFIKVVAELLLVSEEEAKLIIEDSNISVNRKIVLDSNYTLKVNDEVRGFTGHYLTNSDFICKIV